MKRFLIGLAALPFLAGIASAAEPLTNQQMDRVVGGGGAPTVFGVGPSSVTLGTILGGGPNSVTFGTMPSGGTSVTGGANPTGGTSGSPLKGVFGFPAPVDPPAADPPPADPPAAAVNNPGNWGSPAGYAASGGTY